MQRFRAIVAHAIFALTVMFMVPVCILF